jgi:hypothetical protein
VDVAVRFDWCVDLRLFIGYWLLASSLELGP